MADRSKSNNGKHYTIDYLTDRKKTQYRLRFKGLNKLGFDVGDEFKKAYYFETKKEAINWAKGEIETIQAAGQLVEELTSQERANILREAAEIKSKGLDPIEVMREGAKTLSIDQKDLNKPIGDYWREYYEKRVDQNAWGMRHQTLQRQFYRDTKEGFMQTLLISFRSERQGIQIVRKALKKWAYPSRSSVNSVRAARSKMSAFLLYVAGETDAIDTATIKAIFGKGRDLNPLGLRPEQENSRITPQQARYLIPCMAEKKCAAWIVFKLFMGARTELLQRWNWSVVEWEDQRVRIPKKLTKNKKEDVVFDFGEIPNFKEWIEWAWNHEGKPDPSEKICNYSQPSITNRVKDAMNANKALFIDDRRKKLSPADTHRNFMRSAFISYGLEQLGMAKVMRIAEDRYNLDKYIKMDGARSISEETKEYWSLTPENVFAEVAQKPQQ